MTDSPWFWGIFLGANIPVFFGLGWLVFDDWEGFFEAIKYWITPDAWSWIVGEGPDDFWAEMKLLWFVVCCAGVLLVEYYFVVPIFA